MLDASIPYLARHKLHSESTEPRPLTLRENFTGKLAMCDDDTFAAPWMSEEYLRLHRQDQDTESEDFGEVDEDEEMSTPKVSNPVSENQSPVSALKSLGEALEKQVLEEAKEEKMLELLEDKTPEKKNSNDNEDTEEEMPQEEIGAIGDGISFGDFW